jgi:hypothetical protein
VRDFRDVKVGVHPMLRVAAALLLVAATGGTVSAEPMLYVRAFAYGDGNPNGPGAGTVVNGPGPLTSTGAVGNGTASATARASYGNLGATARIDSGDCSINCINRAQAEARWTDEVTITSATLAVDTPVDFTFMMTLDGGPTRSETYSISDSDFYGYGSSGNLYLTWSTPGIAPGARQLRRDRGLSGEGFNVMISNNNDPSPLTFTTSLLVGRTYTVSQSLWASASARDMYALWAEADFLNTATFRIDPVGADYNYVAASGTRYDAVSSVPEPTAGTMLAMVLTVLACRRSAGRRG